jgi:transposase-like protein
VVERTAENKFFRMFVCHGASATGFAACRPLLGLDGTHLKHKYKGILLAATGVDANGSLFPLAHAVVSAENDKNWLWFLQLLRGIVEANAPDFLLQHDSLVLLSDRQKGLLEGVERMFPNCPHGYCLKHLEENFHKQFKDVELKKLLWRAARATTEDDFNQAMNNMKVISIKR